VLQLISWVVATPDTLLLLPPLLLLSLLLLLLLQLTHAAGSAAG
jgi:hypothetical protein